MSVIAGIAIIVWVVLSIIIGVMIQYTLDDPISFKTAFYLDIRFYKKHKNKLNMAGLTIAIAAISLFFLPASITVIISWGVAQFFKILWKIYCCIFAKKKEDRE